MTHKKIKITCLYQVVMHYRLPFYKKISEDLDYEFKIIHGRGKKGSKLINTKQLDSTIHTIELYDFRMPLPFSPTLFFRLIRDNPDIVFSEGSSSLINASLAFLYSKIFNKKFVWWSLGILNNKQYKGLRKLINKWELLIERNADAIFTYSTKGKEYFINRGVKPSNIFVAVNVFDTEAKLKEIERTFQEGYLNKNNFNLGFIGTIQKTKNLELLVDVVEKLNKKYGNIKLHIIGDGEHLNDLKNYVGNNQDVVFHGRMNYGASKVLSNCNIFVLPGLGGLAICEGMLNKLPIITGNADGTEYDLVDDSNGFVIENLNIDTLSEKIEFLYMNRDVLNEMKQNSFKKITTELSFENYYSVFKLMIANLSK